MCALVQPVPDVFKLLQKMIHTTRIHTHILTDAASLALLQLEVPGLFTLLENFPHQPKDLLEPVIQRHIAVSLAPFCSCYEYNYCVVAAFWHKTSPSHAGSAVYYDSTVNSISDKLLSNNYVQVLLSSSHA